MRESHYQSALPHVFLGYVLIIGKVYFRPSHLLT